MVFGPSTTELQAWGAVTMAGGRVVGPTRWQQIVVVVATDEGFKERARERGALFFFKAGGLCSTST